ncbi:MAG: phosphomannomutase/phosphoglucomutase, partial [Firmicutes bacterium]|nr:phosphomannomutase/phosphoglucomutase [Bacillota bacterium]
DAGNGGAGVFAYEIFQRLGCVVFQLNCDPDDSYPHYFPNPSDLAARAQLNKMVLHPYIQADIGISFDGDGDRIGVMDEHGQDIWGDKLLLLLSKQLLLKKKNAKIIFDVKCTQALPEFIQSNGGIPIVCKTGHSYIKAKMKAEGADLGGERSGHIYSGGDEYWGFDDALFAAAKLVEYVSNENKPVSGLVCGFPAYYSSPEIYAKCADRDKYAVVERFAAELQQKFPDNETLTINGVKMFFTDGWGLVRASSNMPELSIVFEAKTKEGLKEIFDLYHSMLSAYPEVDGNWGNIKFD